MFLNRGNDIQLPYFRIRYGNTSYIDTFPEAWNFSFRRMQKNKRNNSRMMETQLFCAVL